MAFGVFEEPKITEHAYSGVYFLCKETERLMPVIENAGKFPGIVRAEVTDPVLHNIEQSADRSGYFIYKSEKKMLF